MLQGKISGINKMNKRAYIQEKSMPSFSCVDALLIDL
jgi:hypothetical protein